MHGERGREEKRIEEEEDWPTDADKNCACATKYTHKPHARTHVHFAEN